MILGQFVQQLLDRMNQDTSWVMVETSYDPLALVDLIENTVLAQTEDHYPFAILYKQELFLYVFHQNTFTNDQWYEKFNTKVDGGNVIGLIRKHSMSL